MTSHDTNRRSPGDPLETTRIGVIGRTTALLAAAAQLASAFLVWTGDGRSGLDLGLLADDATQPTVALALLLLAVLPAVGALISDTGWPRTVSGVLTGGLVLFWLATGPGGEMTDGVVVAIGGAIGQLLAAALAAGPVRIVRVGGRAG